jgi:Mg-chelatase subunit ChlI
LFQYPFTAVVGMERAKRSLLLHAIDPRIGGTLLLGHRGCAKSTLARGFAALLPQDGQKAAPFVEVPLGVTEDRLLGSIRAEVLLQSGQWTPQTGLLEAAHNGVLYLDEVNLLADPLADLLLDSAASGVHRLERDGLSLARNARYILVATMNPDEGDLRPQLADRFAHSVAITDAFTPEERVEIGRRRLAFDDAPEAFLADWTAQTLRLRAELAEARTRLLEVQTPDRKSVV